MFHTTPRAIPLSTPPTAVSPRLRPHALLIALGLALALPGCGDKKKVTATEEEDDDRSKKKRKASSDEDSAPAGSVSGKRAAGAPEQAAPGGGADAPSFKLKGGVVYKVNQTVELTFDREVRAPDGQQYWITLVAASEPDTTFGAWHYVASGAKEDKLVAATAGDFEVRLHDLHPATKGKVLTRQRVSVVECMEDSDCPGSTCQTGKCSGASSNPAPADAPAASGDLAPDGWPATFPPPGSSAPTVAEWNAVTREVTVWGSSALNCETKMVREWLRISCRANHLGLPFGVSHQPSFGQQALKFVAEGSVASVVLQMIPGKDYEATFTWSDVASTSQTVTIRWNQGRPIARFEGAGGE